MGLWPELEEGHDDWLCQTGVLFEELNNAVGQLWVVDRQGLDFMQRQQHLEQKHFVLLFKRQSKAVDNAAKYLEQLSDAVVVLRLVDELVENVVDLFSNVCSQAQEFAVNPVQSRL